MNRFKVVSLVLLAAVVLLAVPNASEARPSWSLYVDYDPNTGNWTVTIDVHWLAGTAAAVQAFQGDLQFDTGVAEYLGMSYVSPFGITGDPDFDLLSVGLIQDFAGSTATPVEGTVDVVTMTFHDLTNGTGTFAGTVFASSNDYVTAYDSGTGTTTTFGPEEIESASVPAVPEPGSLVALGMGASSLIGCGLLRKRRR